MKFENIQVSNFNNALRGMRNPKESWEKQDSIVGIFRYDDQSYQPLKLIAKRWADRFFEKHPEERKDVMYEDVFEIWFEWLEDNNKYSLYKNTTQELRELVLIGPNDMDLAQRLIRAGSEHRKFLREIQVSMDITAPLYWWNEYDTQKVGTVANSTSKMHKLTAKPITLSSFETDDYCPTVLPADENGNYIFSYDDSVWEGNFIENKLVPYLENLRQTYLKTKDERVWKELIRWLPDSWLQTRTVTLSYENLFAMCSPGQRRFHKLSEWRESFIKMVRKNIPYSQELIFIDEIKEDIP